MQLLGFAAPAYAILCETMERRTKRQRDLEAFLSFAILPKYKEFTTWRRFLRMTKAASYQEIVPHLLQKPAPRMVRASRDARARAPTN